MPDPNVSPGTTPPPTDGPAANGGRGDNDLTANGVVVQVAYVPLQPAGCSPLGSVNLYANHYDESVQASADSAAHEFMEAVTDPVPVSGWVDKNGAEIADKCQTFYGGFVKFGKIQWQLQGEWSNAARGCVETTGK